jgi:hypothetical protein
MNIALHEEPQFEVEPCCLRLEGQEPMVSDWSKLLETASCAPPLIQPDTGHEQC